MHVLSRNHYNTWKLEFCLYFPWKSQIFFSLSEASNFEPWENTGRTRIVARKGKTVYIIQYTVNCSNNDSNTMEANDSPWQGFPKETPINSFAYYMNFNITNIWSLARTLKQLFFFESSSPSSIPCWRFHAPKKWDRSSRTLLSCLIRMTSFGCWFPLQVWWFFKKLFILFLLLLMVNSSRKENIVDTILCMLHNHTHS